MNGPRYSSLGDSWTITRWPWSLKALAVILTFLLVIFIGFWRDERRSDQRAKEMRQDEKRASLEAKRSARIDSSTGEDEDYEQYLRDKSEEEGW